MSDVQFIKCKTTHLDSSEILDSSGAIIFSHDDENNINSIYVNDGNQKLSLYGGTPVIQKIGKSLISINNDSITDTDTAGGANFVYGLGNVYNTDNALAIGLTNIIGVENTITSNTTAYYANLIGHNNRLGGNIILHNQIFGYNNGLGGELCQYNSVIGYNNTVSAVVGSKYICDSNIIFGSSNGLISNGIDVSTNNNIIIGNSNKLEQRQWYADNIIIGVTNKFPSTSKCADANIIYGSNNELLSSYPTNNIIIGHSNKLLNVFGNAIGFGLTVEDRQTIIGRWNSSSYSGKDAEFIIADGNGNGEYDTIPHNIFEIEKNTGKVYIIDSYNDVSNYYEKPKICIQDEFENLKKQQTSKQLNWVEYGALVSTLKIQEVNMFGQPIGNPETIQVKAIPIEETNVWHTRYKLVSPAFLTPIIITHIYDPPVDTVTIQTIEVDNDGRFLENTVMPFTTNDNYSFIELSAEYEGKFNFNKNTGFNYSQGSDNIKCGFAWVSGKWEDEEYVPYEVLKAIMFIDDKQS